MAWGQPLIVDSSTEQPSRHLGRRKRRLGKVRTETVKRVAAEVLRKYPDRFVNTFDENKNAVQVLVNFESKRLRNLIAGYVTRLKRTEEMRASLPITDDTDTSLEEVEE